MRINFSTINLDDFRVSNREHEDIGPVVMITPTFTKHSWSPDEFHLRSLMCREDGEVISSGFGKFQNYSENPELDKITDKAILSGEAWFAEKMDGSLLIRSVIDGKVHLRTRGSHTLGEGFKEPIEELISKKYPNLMDPTKDSRYSILFEYTSPDNLVVLQYEEPQLTVLGLVDLTADPVEFYSDPKLVQNLEADYGTPAVKFHDLKGDVDNIIEEIDGWRGSEGIVVWCKQPDGRLHLAKIKAAEYRRIHSIKFQLTSEKVKQLCWYKDIDSVDKLKEEFYRLGVDWEAVSFIEPIFHEYNDRKIQVTELVKSFIAKIKEDKVEELSSRKWKALKLREMAGSNKALFSMGIQYVLGNKNIQPCIDAMVLGVSTKRLENYKKEAHSLSEFVESKIDRTKEA